MNLELFPLLENKNLYTHRLLTPLATKRDIAYDIQRRMLGTSIWRIKKNNVQTIAGRSFTLLQKKFEKDLTHILYYLEHDIYDMKEAQRKSKKLFYQYYKQAYFLGLKASGVGISQAYSNLTFKFSDDPTVYKEEEKWSQTAATAELKFWKGFLSDVKLNRAQKLSMSKRIKLYVESLEGHYNAGRVAGSPNHSVVYWTLERGHKHCPECEWLADRSPWPKELLITTPKAGMCSCLMNCNCSLKITPTTSMEYNRYKASLPSKNLVKRTLKNLHK